MDTTAVEIGSVLSGEVSALHESNLVISLQPSQVKALMSYSTLARHRKISIETLKTELVKGQTIDDLVVVSKNVDKGFVIVGLVPSKAFKAGEQSAETPLSNFPFESLVAGQILSGRICGKVPTGLLVQISRSVRGRVGRTEISDDFNTIDSADVAIGTQAQCYVLSIDVENRRVDLSLRPSRITNGVKARDMAVSKVDDLKAGQTIRGFVKNVANHGVFVSLGSDVTARVQIKVSLW